MQQPEGRILSIDASVEPAHAVVEVAASFVCARCAAGRGCGAGLFAGDAGPRRVDALVPRRLELRTGDRVRLQLAASSVLRAAALVYGLPLCGALIGATLAWWYGGGDAAAALSAIAGAAATAASAHLWLRREDCLQKFTPLVTARLDAG